MFIVAIWEKMGRVIAALQCIIISAGANTVLTEATHSATTNVASTDPSFALDTDVATCTVVPESHNEMWWAAKVESNQFVSHVELTTSLTYLGNILSLIYKCMVTVLLISFVYRYQQRVWKTKHL